MLDSELRSLFSHNKLKPGVEILPLGKLMENLPLTSEEPEHHHSL